MFELLSQVTQDKPRDVTAVFEQIEPLCNGQGPGPGSVRQSITPALSMRRVDDAPLFLNGDLTIRRESFGAILVDAPGRNIRFINEKGLAVLRAFVDGNTASSALGLLVSRGDLEANARIDDFLKEMLLHGVLTASVPPRRGPRFLGFERVSFEPNCYQSPLSATIELTFGCYRRCLHCMNSSSPDVDTRRDLRHTDWIAVLDQLYDAGVAELYLAGGEIFFHPDAAEVIAYADGKGFLLTLVSDLIGYDEERIRFLAGLNNLWSLFVSLDGATAESHDMLRGRGAFEHTTARMRLLQGHALTYGVHTQFHRKNRSEVRSVAELVRDLGASTLTPGVLSPMGRGSEIDSLCLSNQELAALSRDYAQVIVDGVIEPTHRIWKAIATRVITTKDENPLADWPFIAQAGTHHIHVRPNGEVHLSPKLAGSALDTIGDLTRTSVNGIWHDSLIRAARGQVASHGKMTGLDIRVLST